ncbi:hypothetical protein H4582DRAFT_2069539 [Lactarius indigo]|nr:hypothetical protein H4582DRAFT_2069539 [Lactarius indigo]
MARDVNEHTYIMVKIQPPRPPSRGLIDNIIDRFEKRGFKLVVLKFTHATPTHLEKRES